jgi:hypothetical protein
VEKRQSEAAHQVDKPLVTVEFLHFCQHTFLDDYGRANIMGIITQLTPERYPFSFPSIIVAVGLRLEPGADTTIGIQLCTEDGAPQRGARFRIQRKLDSNKEHTFVPFQTVALSFANPLNLIGRVVDDQGLVLFQRTLRILPGKFTR